MQSTRMLAGALMSVSLAAAGLGLATGTALADPSSEHQWCPGQPMLYPTGPGLDKVWDMNVCHTWYWVRYPLGNIQTTSGGPSNVWDGPNPPAGSLVDCGRDLFGFPTRC